MNSLDESALRAGSLCVVGNVNRDLKTAPLRPGAHLFQDGETSVAAMEETIGGGGANSACAAAALGAKVAFLGKVGTDPLGEILERTLRRQGIVARLAKDPDCPTGSSINLTFETGQRHFVSCLPNNQSLTFGDLDLSVLTGLAHLYRADLWFSESMLFEGNRALFRQARERGLAVSVDLNWDPWWGRASADRIQARKQAVRSTLPWVNLAHGNVRELKEFADAPDLETALKRLETWGAEAVVVHLGAEGAGYYSRGALVTEPALPAKSRVNATGSGDVLSVCMMLLHGSADASISEQLRLANRIVSEFIEGRRRLIPELHTAAG